MLCEKNSNINLPRGDLRRIGENLFELGYWLISCDWTTCDHPVWTKKKKKIHFRVEAIMKINK